MKFEFYVLNWDYNRQQAYMFNIFQNSKVNEAAVRAVKRYVRSPGKFKHFSFIENKTTMGFEGLCEEIRSIIAWEERGRFEYEITVGNILGDKQEKWDCFRQAEPNIPAIARELIWQYKHLRSQNVTSEEDKDD